MEKKSNGNSVIVCCGALRIFNTDYGRDTNLEHMVQPKRSGMDISLLLVLGTQARYLLIRANRVILAPALGDAKKAADVSLGRNHRDNRQGQRV